jgi:hexokinase
VLKIYIFLSCHNKKVIIGTGSNACYLEKAINAEFFEKPGKTDDEHVIINTEFGAFGENGSLETIRTDIDREVDDHSINPKNQLFEKMISGFYLGEMVRLVLIKLIKAKVLFNGKLSTRFQLRNEFYTKFLSEIEAENAEGTFEATKAVLLEMGIESPSIDDCKIVRYCCELISCRAAKLVSAALATLILRIGDPKITIGVDGSVYRYHPHFKAMMTKTISELIPSNYKFKFVLSQDGSGRGAALVAAVASRAVTDIS